MFNTYNYLCSYFESVWLPVVPMQHIHNSTSVFQFHWNSFHVSIIAFMVGKISCVCVLLAEVSEPRGVADNGFQWLSFKD